MSSTASMNSYSPRWRGLPTSLPSACWWLERLPIAVLLLSIAFLQGFALRFWSDLLGTTGWGVSVGIEIIHLWAWCRAAVSARFARVGWMVLAVAATGLLLAGALHEVTRPLLQDSARIEANGQERKSLEAESRVLQANLAAFRDMAATQGRRGWQSDIRRDTARLQAITERLRILNNFSDNRTRFPWLNQATQVGVIAVAVLFQIAAVLAIWSLAVGNRNGTASFRADETDSGNISPISTGEIPRTAAAISHPDFSKVLWSRIEAHSARLGAQNGKLTQAMLSRDLGVNPPDLCAIKLISRGQAVPRNPARSAVALLAARFGIEMPK